MLIVRVASLDGSVIFFETAGRALVLSPDGAAFRGFLGREITLDAVFGIIDCPLFALGKGHRMNNAETLAGNRGALRSIVCYLCRRRERRMYIRSMARVSQVLGTLFVLLAGAAQAAPPEVTITFGPSSVTAAGITPGKSAAFFASGLIPDGPHQQIVRWRQIVSDDDHDGSVTLPVDGGAPRFTIWAVVDLTNGRYAVASPPEFHPRVTELPHGAFRRSAGANAVDQFGFDHAVLDLLYVHPGRGAWTWNAVDGRVLDRDASNGITLVAAGDGTPLGDTNGKASEFTAGGVLVAIDWFNLEVLALPLDGAVLGGAH